MKEIIERELEDVLYKFDLLDVLVTMSPDQENGYELEYEYLRGKKDVLLYLLSFFIEQ
jgi:CRISPR/Cas system-associated endonuclease/helicase Cas3